MIMWYDGYHGNWSPETLAAVFANYRPANWQRLADRCRWIQLPRDWRWTLRRRWRQWLPSLSLHTIPTTNSDCEPLLNQSINQSKQIYIGRVSQANQRREMAGTRWSKQCQTVPSLTYGQKYREQFTGSTVKWRRVPDSRGANTKGFGRQCQWRVRYCK